MLAANVKDAYFDFGRLINLARTEPKVASMKYSWPVFMVMAVEEFEKMDGDAVFPSLEKGDD